MVTCFESRGSTQMEWMPGHSAPLGPQSSRMGSSQSDRTSSQESPLSSDLKSPPGIVPHQTTPGSSGPPGAMDQTSLSAQSRGLLKKGTGFGTYPSGIAGYCGVVLSFHVLPPFRDRCILT